MSLEALTQLRLKQEFIGECWVIVGNLPEWLVGNSSYIFVNPDKDPMRLDWSPLKGCGVNIFELGNFPHVMDRLGIALDNAKALNCSLASPDGAFGVNQVHERLLNEALAILMPGNACKLEKP